MSIVDRPGIAGRLRSATKFNPLLLDTTGDEECHPTSLTTLPPNVEITSFEPGVRRSTAGPRFERCGRRP